MKNKLQRTQEKEFHVYIKPEYYIIEDLLKPLEKMSEDNLLSEAQEESLNRYIGDLTLSFEYTKQTDASGTYFEIDSIFFDQWDLLNEVGKSYITSIAETYL